MAAIVAFGWWAPKAEFACNATPWGPPTARDAAEGFAASLVEQDAAHACSVTSSRYDKDGLSDLLESASKTLGDPDSTEEITVSLGEQMGSGVDVSLQTPTGELTLGVQAHAYQWRVISVGEE
ncbi:hypothetical protein [Tessaracoccus palaemonis]|uniref:DUF4333 domain-containing protein n=1 Tax=Tessaracoccus palaemonis TaxID=2829499 RepID=A0ABX8SPV6_9ACTN|nr:hypothetical protein [Tessaracoccus palaemonis]QXT64153.1 hypothetical protein KDB89_06805 [Tessaracoccus palaemonis]